MRYCIFSLKYALDCSRKKYLYPHFKKDEDLKNIPCWADHVVFDAFQNTPLLDESGASILANSNMES